MSVRRSGIVLAGGEGKRMGGAYKPLVPYRDRPLISWALDALAPPFCDEIVIAHGPAPLRADLVAVVGARARFVPDDGGGPASGLRAAAEAAKGGWLLVAPADSPNLTRLVYEDLLGSIGQRDGACALADGVVNALVGVYRRDALLAALWTGARSPREAIGHMDVVAVPLSAWDLRDIDSPGDLALP